MPRFNIFKRAFGKFRQDSKPAAVKGENASSLNGYFPDPTLQARIMSPEYRERYDIIDEQNIAEYQEISNGFGNSTMMFIPPPLPQSEIPESETSWSPIPSVCRELKLDQIEEGGLQESSSKPYDIWRSNTAYANDAQVYQQRDAIARHPEEHPVSFKSVATLRSVSVQKDPYLQDRNHLGSVSPGLSSKDQLPVSTSLVSAKYHQVMQSGLYSSEDAAFSDSESYHYIIPAGMNVIFQDEDGQEIARVGEFHPSGRGRRRKIHPVIIQDEYGNELYRTGARITMPELSSKQHDLPLGDHPTTGRRQHASSDTPDTSDKRRQEYQGSIDAAHDDDGPKIIVVDERGNQIPLSLPWGKLRRNEGSMRFFY